MKSKFRALFGVVALAMAGQVSAVTSWSFSNLCSNPSGTTTITCTGLQTSGATNGDFVITSDGTSVTASGWADDAAHGSVTQQLGTQSTSTTHFYSYGGGLGINSGTEVWSASPDHAIDNSGAYEMVLLSFSSSVKLTSASIGWSSTDADISVLAYTGSGNPAPTTFSAGWSTLASNTNWAKIGDYGSAASGSTITVPVNDGTKTSGTPVYSSYWLIGAYNPLVGNTTVFGSVGTGTPDYIKLASVTGDICTNGTGPSCKPGTPPGSVPEPGSLALVGFALMSMMSLRKRRQA